MNGELSNVIALAAHGTAFLARGGEPPDVLGMSAFRFCRDIKFRRDTGPDGTIAGSSAWFLDLRERGAEWLHLAFFDRPGRLEPHDAAGFSNGGNWSLHDHARPWGDEWWIGRASFDKQTDADRPWSMDFGNNSPAPAPQVPVLGLAESASSLRSAIHDAIMFEEDTGGAQWRSHSFTPALAALGAEVPMPVLGGNLLPEQGYSQAARQTLAAASHAWVFGGMGWWNDNGFADPDIQRRFIDVTRSLYRAVTQAIAASVNSYDVGAM